jgi:uncharacterized protein (UPF0218 family)
MRILPEELRDELKEPIGKLVDEQGLLNLIKEEEYLVTVGDLVTLTLIKNQISPKIAIVDYISRREEFSEEKKQIIKDFGSERIQIKNPPGTLTDELWNAIDSSYKNIEKGPILIEVDGEEDLASLAAIYLAPSYVTVIYGLPNKGILVVKPTIENKNKAKEVLDKM